MILGLGLVGIGFLFMSITVSVVAHNIMHESVFKSEPLNRLMEYWVIMFYGTPVFGWIPTHYKYALGCLAPVRGLMPFSPLPLWAWRN